MKLIVGLGNIGENYTYTRHNTGFLALDWLANEFNVKLAEQSKLRAFIGRDQTNDWILAKPTTLMNLSGQAVKNILEYYKIPLDELIIIHDDADLEQGEIKTLDETNSGAGHHGVLSVLDYVGPGFKRIRIGIGRPEQPERDISDYVLSRLNKEDIISLNKVFSDNLLSLLK